VLATFPRTLIPLVVFNVVGFGLGGDPWSVVLAPIPMPSGVTWSTTLGDIAVAIALIVLFLDVLRAARVHLTLTYHAAGMTVLAVYAIEFLVIGAAATSVFFTLTLIALVDTALVVVVSRARRQPARNEALVDHAADGYAGNGTVEVRRPSDGDGAA